MPPAITLQSAATATAVAAAATIAVLPPRATRTMTTRGGTVTRSERVTNKPERLEYSKLGKAMTETRAFTSEELKYYEALCMASGFGAEEANKEETQVGFKAGKVTTSHLFEVADIGAAVGGGFNNTAELRPMKYKEELKSDHKLMGRSSQRRTQKIHKVQSI